MVTLTALHPEKSTNVREIGACLLSGLAEMVRPRTLAERAADAYLTPRREVAPPMLPEPAGGSVELPVDGFPVHLNVRQWGAGEGRPTILLVHGWEGQLTDLVRFVEPLVDRGYRVVAFDAPAHGRSSGDQASVMDFARAVLAIARVTGPLAAAIGHSMGAAALTIAREQGLEVGRLVLIGTPPGALRFARHVGRSMGLDADESAEMTRILDLRIGRPVSGLSPAISAANVTEDGLAVPALFVHSIDDRIAPVADALRTAAVWRGSRIHLTEGLGHRRILFDADTLAEVVAFIGPSVAIETGIDGAATLR